MQYFKKILLGSTMLYSTIFGDTLSEAFKAAEVDGEVRVVYYGRDADNSILAKASGVAVGGHLGITTAPIYNTKASVVFYTTNPIDPSTTLMPNTNLVDGTDGYTIVGEANIEYNDGTNMLKVGRQTLATPLVASDDARVIKDLFEAANFTSTILPKTKLHLLYIHRNSGMDNGDSNYNPAVSKKDFVAMSTTLNASYKKGMVVVGIENSPVENLKVSAWYYGGLDFINMYYGDASYLYKQSKDLSLKFEGHLWNIKSTSRFDKDREDVGRKVDYLFGGVRLSAIYKEYVFQLAQERIDYADKAGSVHTAWGMYSEYTYGFLMGSGMYGALNGYQDSYIQKVDATKLTAIYNFAKGATLYGSYNWWRGDNDAFQSNLDTIDILVTWPCMLVENGRWQVIYENWNSKSNNIMVDNNLARVKYTYTF